MIRPITMRLCFPTDRNASSRTRLRLTLVSALAVGLSGLVPPGAGAQTTPLQVMDASGLRPPAGARVAIVEFDDLQCPACAATNTTLKAAAAQYKIPWVRHDFLIPYHNWSRNAAIDARWFDLKGQALGDEYRDQVFANQTSIYNPDVLFQFTQKFAQSHGMALPFAMDPQGALAREVDADVALARRTGIRSTPTIFVVTNGSKGPSYVQVLKPSQDLYSDIDKALASTASTGQHAH